MRTHSGAGNVYLRQKIYGLYKTFSNNAIADFDDKSFHMQKCLTQSPTPAPALSIPISKFLRMQNCLTQRLASAPALSILKSKSLRMQ